MNGEDNQPTATPVLDNRIRRLKIQSDRLTALMADPQPGLSTWMAAVPATVSEINAIMDGKRD